jgi:hypothetical protein
MVLGLAALALLIDVLSGSGRDETPQRAIAMALALAFFVPLTAAGITLAQRRPELGPLGHLATAACVIAFVIVAVSIWSNSVFSGDWRPAGYSLLIALGIGQVSVLLAFGRREDPELLRLLRGATIIATAILVAIAVSEISSPGPDFDFKGMAVAAIAYGFGTLVLLLIAWLDGAADALALGPARAPTRSGAIDHVGIPVAEWEGSGAFYRDVLGADARPAYADHTFTWSGSAASAIEHLHSHGVEVLGPPAGREGAGGRGQSIYFRDPAGRLIELIAYG